METIRELLNALVKYRERLPVYIAVTLILVAFFIFPFVIIECRNENANAKEIPQTQPSTDRFSFELVQEGVYIVRDTETGNEWLLVKGAYSITPLPPNNE